MCVITVWHGGQIVVVKVVPGTLLIVAVSQTAVEAARRIRELLLLVPSLKEEQGRAEKVGQFKEENSKGGHSKSCLALQYF